MLMGIKSTDRVESKPVCLSEYWRKNTSAQEAVELANLLRALCKVAGHLGQNVGPIEYAGMSRPGAATIVLEPGMVMGQYPIPPEKTDYLVGMVTHKALHRIEWSDRIWKLLEPLFEELSPLARVKFQKIIHTGEDIYVDLVADRTVFGLYTPKMRKDALEAAKRRLRADEISVDGLVYRWRAHTWGKGSDGREVSVYGEALRTLARLTEALRQVCRMNKGISARCQQRADCYMDAWRQLEKPLSSWKVVDKRLHYYAPRAGTGWAGENSGTHRQEANTPLSNRLAQQVQVVLARHATDVTPIIQQIVGYGNDEVVPTSRWDFNQPAHPVIDRRLVSRLKMVFRNYSARKTVLNRGLLSGKVDGRRLYRAPVTGQCFQQVDRLPELDWNVALLMDATGSMRGNKWRRVENTVANLHQAFLGFRNHLQAYAYFEMDGVCMISQLIKERRLFSVPPHGQTASGQAILAVAYFMSKKRQRNLLIHVTDGKSNFGCKVQYGIDYCREQNIHLVTLGCGCQDREAMRLQYGNTLQFLDHFGQLPQAMERLFRWTFLYGTRGRKSWMNRCEYLKEGQTAFIEKRKATIVGH